MIEVSAFWLTAAYSYGQTIVLLKNATQQADAPLLIGSASRLTIVSFSLVVIYGLFVPNRWKKVLWVSTPIVIAPPVIVLAFLSIYPAISEIEPRFGDAVTLSGMIMFLLLGLLASTLGSHTIHQLRTNAFHARQYGQYRLQDRIGKGGMGEVWKADHGLLARPAAIKLIRPEMLDAKQEQAAALLKRFEREAQATAKLRSPHTVEIYDFGTLDDGTFYYVMEILEGIDLETLVERYGPVPPERVLYLLRQSCLSLGEAHAGGLVHRDIKPANLFTCRVGLEHDFIKILDFGLVKEHSDSESTRLTALGVATGTPAYMPPEIAVGREDIDGRADIYSLGCVGYWLLTGQLVFEAKTPFEIVAHHISTDPVPPSRKTELAIPEGLEQVILACLAKEPEERPAGAERLLQLLDQCDLDSKWDQPQARQWWTNHGL